MERVSVIIPAYQSERYIEACLDSLTAQNYRELEIIVVDNGSTDQTSELVRRHPSATLLREEQKGVAHARNRGLSHATGDYILFLDSDDTLDEGAVEQLVAAAKEAKADIVRFRLRYLYPDGKRLEEKPTLPNKFLAEKKEFYKTAYRGMMTGIRYNSVCRCMYRTTLVKDMRFDTELQTAEDLLFNIKAFTKAERFCYRSDIFYNYLQTGKGITGSHLAVAEKYACNKRVEKELLKQLPAWGIDTLFHRLLVKSRIHLLTISKLRRMLFPTIGIRG